ncbi:hypothetical protein [Oryza sativa Japonica Group]|uniref:Uncharacterized protein P0416D03.19 n=1 Tax=Oryza sativa subsp. japonica TaxID=39947 RepID=Q5ZDN4_ORYSJ|nr:hypothetical protein [Oryza sativa Japonica Group]
MEFARYVGTPTRLLYTCWWNAMQIHQENMGCHCQLDNLCIHGAVKWQALPLF